MYHTDDNYLSQVDPISAEDFINSYSTILKIDDVNKNKIIYVAQMAEILGLVSENTPSSIAVGSIYLISQTCNLKISKKILAEKCEISEVTIAKTYKKILKFKKYLIPSSDTE
jgi:transcription initiation factor TFIIIB Brf1 subunit/transcription initiation factor TFIIB